MEKWVKCVPNFSEGRDQSIIHQIGEVIENVETIHLLNVDSGISVNRTVMTFIGLPDHAVEAAFRAVKKASVLIDMSKHQGIHSRMGGTDVCPLVPMMDTTMEECIDLAKKLGDRIGRELDIPVYLYGKAAMMPSRVKLSNIRQRGYETLRERLKDPVFEPDFGPMKFNPKTGAIAVGARDVLLAYNVNLNTRDPQLAQNIAMNIRESGRAKRDGEGEIVRDDEGRAVQIPGKLPFCQASGWYIEEYDCAQVTMNLLNYRITGFHTAFESVKGEAERLRLEITGSELIGMTPKQALVEAGEFYLKKEGKKGHFTEEEVIQTAISSLGLNHTDRFHPDEKIIEYALEKRGIESYICFPLSI
ncbi:glutamate formimidoyltransferase [bacterium]|nr:glutamate formimidoyltransferase [bacterium]